MPDAPGHPAPGSLRLVLVDTTPQVVDAWRQALADAGVDRDRLEVVQAGILEVDADAVVAPGDSFGTMGGGVDLAIVDRHGPAVRDRVQRAIDDHADGELPVGQALLVPLAPSGPRWLVVAPTMRVPMRLPPGSVNPYLAMRAALRAVRHGTIGDSAGGDRPAREPVGRLAVPGLGTGTGRVAPAVAARQMVAAVADVLHGGHRAPRRWEQLVATHHALAAPTSPRPRPAPRRVSMSQPPAMLAGAARGTATVDRRSDRAIQEASMQAAFAPARGQQLAGRFAQAVAYAATAHGDQVRKGTDLAYVSHLLAVAALVLEHGGSEPQTVAAVLHDVVEDGGGRPRLDDVRATFGDDVAAMVDDLSDAAPAPGEAKPPWRQRKRSYLDHLAGLVDAGAPAVLVSCCDKLHNAEAIVADATDPDGEPGLAVFDRFTAGPADTAWYYRELAQRFRTAALPTRLVARLNRAVDRLADLAVQAAAREQPAAGA